MYLVCTMYIIRSTLNSASSWTFNLSLSPLPLQLTLFLVGCGGFGGPRASPDAVPTRKNPGADREPDQVREYKTTVDQVWRTELESMPVLGVDQLCQLANTFLSSGRPVPPLRGPEPTAHRPGICPGLRVRATHSARTLLLRDRRQTGHGDNDTL